MQRLASTKNSSLSGTGMGLGLADARLLLGFQPRGVLGRCRGFGDAHRAHLEFRNLRDRILSGDGELVGALASSPMIRNEYIVGTDRLHHGGAQGAAAAAAFHVGPVAVA